MTEKARSPGPAWLHALGRTGLPPHIRLGDCLYKHVHTFKHDFFAATGLYDGPNGRVVLKVGRMAGVWGIPLLWIGRRLAAREARLLKLAQGLQGVPRLDGRWGRTGIVREFIEGRPLQKGDPVGDTFFPRLRAIIDGLHARRIAYVDLEKPENIIVGDDGVPYLIDFQISWHWPASRGGETALARWFLGVLQQADRYHLMKHWRRLRPDQLDPLESTGSSVPFWIAWHRAVFRPMTRLRRTVLVWVGARSSRHGRSPG